MQEIVYILGALRVFYTSAHWRSKGALFYQNHLLFARLYESLDDEVDALVELIIGFNGDSSFVEPKVFNDGVQAYTPSGNDDAQGNLSKSLALEETLLERISTLTEEDVSTGIYNQLANIAENHTRNLYLIKQTLR